jgi:hypothetical protein
VARDTFDAWNATKVKLRYVRIQGWSMTTPFDVYNARRAFLRSKYRDRGFMKGKYWKEHLDAIRDLARITGDQRIIYIVIYCQENEESWTDVLSLLYNWESLNNHPRGFLVALVEFADESDWCEEFLDVWSDAQKYGAIPKGVSATALFQEFFPSRNPSFMDHDWDDWD